MKNRVDFNSTVDAVYALSSLNAVINDNSLPGPLGRDEEEGLVALAARMFNELCADIGAEPDGDCVDLPADVHTLLQAVVTDRTIAELTLRAPRGDLMRRLRCRLRPLPPRTAKHY